MEHPALLELLKDMSLEEKIGQLIQVHATMLGENGVITGPTGSIPMDDQTRTLTTTESMAHGLSQKIRSRPSPSGRVLQGSSLTM